MSLIRIKNRLIAKIITRFPSLAKKLLSSYEPRVSDDVPWTPLVKALGRSTIAIVTTAGVHPRDQQSFDMHDPNGDPSFRAIDIRRPLSDLTITHDYYDHTDADKDINIVFPAERLKEFEHEGLLGKVADIHYGFMGHITDSHILTLIDRTAPEVAKRLKNDRVDIVLLLPG